MVLLLRHQEVNKEFRESHLLQRAGSLLDACWRPPPSASPHRQLQNGTHAPSSRQDLFCNPKFRFGVPSAKYLQFDGPGGQSTAEGMTNPFPHDYSFEKAGESIFVV